MDGAKFEILNLEMRALRPCLRSTLSKIAFEEEHIAFIDVSDDTPILDGTENCFLNGYNGMFKNCTMEMTYILSLLVYACWIVSVCIMDRNY